MPSAPNTRWMNDAVQPLETQASNPSPPQSMYRTGEETRLAALIQVDVHR